jgi:hypothetical protein
MKLKLVKYSDLNTRQKEIYNFQKVASVLADYGFHCIKLSDDWQAADFLAYHKDGKDSLRIQLKGRLAIDKKYQGRKLIHDLSGLRRMVSHRARFAGYACW